MPRNLDEEIVSNAIRDCLKKIKSDKKNSSDKIRQQNIIIKMPNNKRRRSSRAYERKKKPIRTRSTKKRFSKTRTSSKKSIQVEQRKSKQEEARELFQAEKEKILQDLPEDYKARWGEIAFARWKRVWRPVVILSPYSVSSNTRMRKNWMTMFANTKGQRDLMWFLCYWLGDEEIAFTYTYAKDILDYQEGVARGFDTLPPAIQRKKDAGKALGANDLAHARAIEMLPEEVAKLPEERIPFEVFEEYELPNEQIITFRTDQDDSNDEQESEESHEEEDDEDDEDFVEDDDDDDEEDDEDDFLEEEVRKRSYHHRSSRRSSGGNNERKEPIVEKTFVAPKPEAIAPMSSSIEQHNEEDMVTLNARRELLDQACKELRLYILDFNRSCQGLKPEQLQKMQMTRISTKTSRISKVKEAVFQLGDKLHFDPASRLGQLAEAASTIQHDESCASSPERFKSPIGRKEAALADTAEKREEQENDLRVQREELEKECKKLLQVTDEFIASQERGGRLAIQRSKIIFQAEEVLAMKNLVIGMQE